jgi:hypothetical protein
MSRLTVLLSQRSLSGIFLYCRKSRIDDIVDSTIMKVIPVTNYKDLSLQKYFTGVIEVLSRCRNDIFWWRFINYNTTSCPSFSELFRYVVKPIFSTYANFLQSVIAMLKKQDCKLMIWSTILFSTSGRILGSRPFNLFSAFTLELCNSNGVTVSVL